jgi:hypothetical protein
MTCSVSTMSTYISLLVWRTFARRQGMAGALLLLLEDVRFERDAEAPDREGEGPPRSLLTHDDGSTRSRRALGSVVEIDPASQASGRSCARMS